MSVISYLLSVYLSELSYLLSIDTSFFLILKGILSSYHQYSLSEISSNPSYPWG